MKTLQKHWLALLGIFTGGLVVMAAALTAWSQTAPILSITPLGTNQFSITFTNTGTTYDLQWTPALANPDYPWTWAAVGTNNQTNFSFDMSGYETAFFRAILDTNSVPLWEAADPNNPAAGILTVTIDSPTNGSNLTQ